MNDRRYTIYETAGRSKRRWLRVTAWTFLGLVIVLMGAFGGSYLWFRGQVVDANERVAPEVRTVLTAKPPSTLVSVPEPESPSAMNILVLGSDRRVDEPEKYGRSDTIILVHVDPDANYLSMLSFPRDLRVQIPGYGRDKINSAFARGGPALTIRTVEQLTGVDIDHFMEVGFDAFRDITDALGGVYIDVDRRYYNDNPQWELIKLAPGYQLLNGSDALDYVRFRHDLNCDFGRMARQQRFLAALREQAMGWDLPFKLPRLVSALFDNISTDLGATDILQLVSWAVRLDGGNIRQIGLQGATEDRGDISYVIADDSAIAEAVKALLTRPSAASAPGPTTTAPVPASERPTATTVGLPDLSGLEVDVLNANGRTGEAAAAGEWLAAAGATVVGVGNASVSGLEITRVDYPSGESEAARLLAETVGVATVSRTSAVERVTLVLGEDFTIPTEFRLPAGPATIPNSDEWRALAGIIPFPIQAPSYLPDGFRYVDRMPPKGATYEIDTGGGSEPAFKMIYRLLENGRKTDQYMGITQTTWVDAPAAGKGVEVVRDGVTFTIVGTDRKVERVWWEQDGVLYWVSNTLSYLIDADELLAVAQSMIEIPKP